MKTDVYRQLQRHLDNSAVPFPETQSGIEISLLKKLFDEEEANIALNLSALPETIDKILNRFIEGEITKELLASKLKGLFEKGAILSFLDPKGEQKYQKIPLVNGMFEHQVDHLSKDFTEDFYKYEEEVFADALYNVKTKQLRTIPVDVKIDPEFLVGSYDNARSLIEKSPGPFAVINCICRQAKEKVGEPCKQTDDYNTCLTIEEGALYMMSRGVAREISKEEMMNMVSRAEEKGMVLQPENAQEPRYICCCCGCCCEVLTKAKLFPNPVEYVHTNFYARIAVEKCAACGDCIELCQMDALVSVNNHTEVKLSHCIGCGVCVNACSNEAISLLKTQKETIPPKTSKDMYNKMVMDRYGVLGSLKFMAKAALGKKI